MIKQSRFSEAQSMLVRQKEMIEFGLNHEVECQSQAVFSVDDKGIK